MAAPETKTPPPRRIVTVTYKTGETVQLDLSPPRLAYDANRLGVADDEIEAGFFIVWAAAGKPGLNGHDFTIDNARPALESWLDGVASVETEEQSTDGPPTKPPKRSRGQRG